GGGVLTVLAVVVEEVERALALRPAHRIVWVARNGAEAVERCATDTPDLVLMDLVMPLMDGVEASRRIMARTPCAILVVTVSVEANASQVFEAMGHGALDAVDTPALGRGDSRQTPARLLAKIDRIASLLGDGNCGPRPAVGGGVRSGGLHTVLIAVGASAGGPAAVARVLSGLPRRFSAAVVVVQHVDA